MTLRFTQPPAAAYLRVSPGERKDVHRGGESSLRSLTPSTPPGRVHPLSRGALGVPSDPREAQCRG